MGQAVVGRTPARLARRSLAAERLAANGKVSYLRRSRSQANDANSMAARHLPVELAAHTAAFLVGLTGAANAVKLW